MSQSSTKAHAPGPRSLRDPAGENVEQAAANSRLFASDSLKRRTVWLSVPMASYERTSLTGMKR